MSLPSSRRVALPPRAALRVAGAAGSARIVQAGHERLIVAYSVRDGIACVLTPPGEVRFATTRVRCHGHEFNSFHFTISNRLRTHSAGCYRTVCNVRNVR